MGMSIVLFNSINCTFDKRQSQVDSLAGIIFVESENSKGVNYNQKALRTA